jgi:hypothetical protein
MDQFESSSALSFSELPHLQHEYNLHPKTTQALC